MRVEFVEFAPRAWRAVVNASLEGAKIVTPCWNRRGSNIFASVAAATNEERF